MLQSTMQSIQNFDPSGFIDFIHPILTKPAFTRSAGFWTNPDQEHNNGFFEQLTNINAQRENWYQVTPYVAEFWCTVSNVAIIYAGIKSNSPELIFAGLASTASHTVPKQWLLYIDKLGILIVAISVFKNYQTVYNNPQLGIPLAGVALLPIMDAHLARRKGVTWPHIIWHCASAALVGYFFHLVGQYKV